MRNKCLFLLVIIVVGAGMLMADDQDKKERLIGRFTLQQILDFDKEHADAAFIYIPDSEALAVFQAVKEPVKIMLFLRTDCPDSIREVPRFIKTIQLADNPDIEVVAIAVNRAKDKPADLVKGWSLERIPTFIIMRGDEELGRVVEKPEEKVEVALAKILKK